jgi:hypothetical protein
MSELIQSQTAARDVRWSLLATVSSLALATATCIPAHAADETDRATVWIELGAQLDRIQGSETPYLPPFLDNGIPRPFETVSSAAIQRSPRYSLGGEGKISFEPHGSDWSLAAAVRYGRSSSVKHLHQQTSEIQYSGVNLMGTEKIYNPLTKFTDTTSAHKASYLIADFTAGHDVGLGLWSGNHSTSVDFGVRFAQFTAKTNTAIHELPDDFKLRVPLPPSPFFPNFHKYKTYSHHHSFYGQNSVTRSFSGLGPTLSLHGSQPLSEGEEGAVTFDWGINAAVLFGRQRVNGSHQTTGAYWADFQVAPKSTYDTGRKPFARSRSVVVPNIGGFAGFSARYSNAKLSFGYRGDFFFGAMDGGLEARDAGNRSFHGPFATVSFGLGG